jgi:hypothetical protein
MSGEVGGELDAIRKLAEETLMKLADEELRALEDRLFRLEWEVLRFEEKVHRREGGVSEWDVFRFLDSWHAMVQWFFVFADYLDPRDARRVGERLLALRRRIEGAHKEYLRSSA